MAPKNKNEKQKKAAPDNKRLDAVSRRAAQVLINLITEAEDDILKAMAACEDEAEVQETSAKMRLGFTVTLDLDKEFVAHALTFGIRKKLEVVEVIADPNQLTFPTELEALKTGGLN